MNPVKALENHDQAIWLDFLARGFVAKGDLQALIETDGIQADFVRTRTVGFEAARAHALGIDWDEIARASGAFASLPCSSASAAGTMAKNAARAVIVTGRTRIAAAFRIASVGESPSFRRSS